MDAGVSAQTYLLLDIGNSCLKWNIWQQGARQFSSETQRTDYKDRALAEVLDDQWRSIDNSIQNVFVANVAGDAIAKQVETWCVDHWGIHPKFAKTSASFKSVQNGYYHYGELGVDRWLAVIAAHERFPGKNAIVIDCGTALTVDAVTPNGQHHAGPIIPGRKMMFQALASNAADLSDMSEKNTSASVFADNTQKAIVSGVNFAISSVLDAVLSEMRQKLAAENDASKIIVIATGGAAETVMSITHIKDFTIEPDLVLTGLRSMAVEKQ